MSHWIKNHFLSLTKNQSAKSIFVIRHGHREEHQQGAFGNGLALTWEGKQASVSLGQTIAPIPLGEIHTSPVLRCIQTTEEILKGANQNVKVICSKVLGDPGPFIRDSEKAGSLFLQKSVQKIAQELIDEKDLPGMCSLDEGGRMFLNYIFQIQHSPCLMISHDIIICLLCCFLFKSKNVENYMPNFLEGFAIMIGHEYLSVYYQDQKHYLKRRNLISAI